MCPAPQQEDYKSMSYLKKEKKASFIAYAACKSEVWADGTVESEKDSFLRI